LVFYILENYKTDNMIGDAPSAMGFGRVFGLAVGLPSVFLAVKPRVSVEGLSGKISLSDWNKTLYGPEVIAQFPFLEELADC
jgi:hypothetical protein